MFSFSILDKWKIITRFFYIFYLVLTIQLYYIRGVCGGHGILNDSSNAMTLYKQ